MLRSLNIRNFAIIDESGIEFESGFTAITGETGAGKSILLNALKLILGAKARSDLIRQGADKLRVEAVFNLPSSPALRELLGGLELDVEDELTLERELTSAGKNRARVNGTLVTLADLEAIGRHLVDLHGQHEQQGLLDTATHGAYLDGSAGLSEEATAYTRLYSAFRSSESALRQAEEDAGRLREQIEFLQFQFKELDKAGLREGEEEKLEGELKMLSGLEKVVAGQQACLEALEGQTGALGALGRLERELQNLAKHLPGVSTHSTSSGQARSTTGRGGIDEAREILSQLRDELRHLNIPASADPVRIDALNARLALFQKLRTKYKTNLAGLIGLRDRRKEEISRVENAEVETASLNDQRDAALAAAKKAAKALSDKRHAAAKKFDAEVNKRLAQLGMEGSRFETRFQLVEGEGLGTFGLDRIEFFLAANAGEPTRSLKQSASGGEISRVMLAIKGALAQGDPRPVLVFDELDTGIGGTTALRIGEALVELAKHHQLLVITHLHQVAAQASHQHRVVKTMEGGRTVTNVLPLKEKDRAAELARMMGDEGSDAALRHAKELLRKGG